MRTFVDTGGWFASFIPTEPRHSIAKAWLDDNRGPLVTTDYVIDELLTLMRARGESRRAIHFGALIVSGRYCQIERVSTEDFAEAWAIFSSYRDKAWSFTDCASRVVMARLGITRAFAFDDHFRQFGTVAVVP